MEGSDEEKLERIFAVMRGPTDAAPTDAKTEAEWPSLVARGRAEAERRIAARRRRRVFAALAVAAVVLAAAGVAWFVTHPKEAPRRIDGPTVGVDIWPTPEGDLLRESVLEDCLRAVDADAGQRAQIAAIASESRAQITSSSNMGDIARVQSSVRAKIGEALTSEQRKRLDAFTVERDRRGRGN